MKYALILGCLLALSGCSVQEINRQNPLSPTEAIASFKALGYDEWAGNPFVRTEAFCGAEKVRIQFSEINVAAYSLRQSKLTLATDRKGICSSTYAFTLKDKEDASRLVTAANSLGANVKYLVTVD